MSSSTEFLLLVLPSCTREGTIFNKMPAQRKYGHSDAMSTNNTSTAIYDVLFHAEAVDSTMVVPIIHNTVQMTHQGKLIMIAVRKAVMDIDD